MKAAKINKLFTLYDIKVILTRKLLHIEQFRDERARHLATIHFFTQTKDIYLKIFMEMMDNGILKKDNPDMMAFIFTAPITSLIHYCDREPEKEREIMRQSEGLVRYFIDTYGKKK